MSKSIASDNFEINESKIKADNSQSRSAVAGPPGLRRVRVELARPNPLVRTFDNKC